jgi:hypothetical protein
MPGPLYDCYVLAPRRSAEIAARFLDRFIPERRPSFDPDDPHQVIGVPQGSTVEEVLRFLESNPTVPYTMYWSNERAGPPYNAILSFTEDGCLILGISPSYDHDEVLARQTLAELKQFAASSQGYASVEEPPAGSRQEFLSRAESEVD